MTAVIWWVRRDLRLHDNDALDAALASGSPVIPVFVLDPELLRTNRAADKRLAFLFGGLRALDADLRARGSRLIVRSGPPAGELATLCAETRAAAIYAEADPWSYARQRDAAIARDLPLTLTHGLTIRPYDVICKAAGDPYTVFTPYSRAWKSLPLPIAADLHVVPDRLAAPPDPLSVAVPGAPELPSVTVFPPGETEARRRLSAFAAGRSAPIATYGETRNRMDLDGTSELSPYLRFGMVSARAAAVAALQAIDAAPGETARRSAETWLNELIWREFYQSVLHHFPAVLTQEFQAGLRNIPWRNDRSEFAAWCEGRTGYPVVDAAMRQLVQSGWMHNRARMIAASFLVKDLLVDWRWGEDFFMQHLVDADPASNNGGWQWTAGVGTDAAPYFRVFNPVLQSQKFDPEGAYIRRWLPELHDAATRYIHAPWTMPTDEQRAAGVAIGKGYPGPVVDHALARERTLLAFKAGGQNP